MKDIAPLSILGIHGSPRGMRSRTRRLVNGVLQGAEEDGAAVELVDLVDYSIQPCTACESCSLTGACVHSDDFFDLFARMSQADGIVLGSPVYIDNVSGQMKIFIDRLADAMHYQALTGKYGCAVSTTWSSGGEEVVAYLNHVLNYLGILATGGVQVALYNDPLRIQGAEPAARDLGRRLVQAIRTGAKDPDQEAIFAENRECFRYIVEENREWRRGEYQEWVRRGWIEGNEQDPYRTRVPR